MDNFEERIGEKIRRIQEKAEQRQSAQVVQLPIWPESVRGVPNGVLRSALFGVVRRGKRQYVEKEQIAAVDGVRIFYTGQRLDQADLDVWEHVLHLARTSPLGTEVYFTAHAFLRAIGRDTGKKQYKWLEATLLRLMTCTVEISYEKRTYAGHLIDEWARDKSTGQHFLRLNPKIATLYGSDRWTAIEWEKRLAMRGQQLAQWLHGFYSTHAEPYPIKVETLRRLSGSEVSQLRKFRQLLKNALDALAMATGWKWHIDDNFLYIEKKPTPSQAKHLVRRKARLAISAQGGADPLTRNSK